MKTDTITKDYISDAVVFADVFNYYIHNGKQVIKPEQLEERDPTEIALPYGAEGTAVPVQRFRDAQKLCAAMTDGELCYVLYGVEAQSEVHYAAAVKNNLYDDREETIDMRDMCQAMKDIRMKERQNGERNKAQESAKSFYQLGVDVETIALGVGYALETVKEWLGLSDDQQESQSHH